MRKLLRFLRHQFKEYWLHILFIFIAAGFIVVAQKPPEELIAEFIKEMPEWLREHWPAFLDTRTSLTAIGVAIIVLDVLVRAINSFRKPPGPKIDVTLSMFQHTDINAALIELTIQNKGKRPEQIKRVEFTTKGQWDIPDYSIWPNPEPVFNRLKGENYIKVSNELGSKANKAIGKTLEPRKILTVTFFLTTDHSPSPEVGVFPFHLGCELVYGADQRIRLPDIVVSLHGQAIKSFTQVTGHGAHPLAKPGEARARANEVLSRIDDSVECHFNLLPTLQMLAGVERSK
jgi:hypothetical protein